MITMSNDFRKFILWAVVVAILLIVGNIALDAFWGLNDVVEQSNTSGSISR